VRETRSWPTPFGAERAFRYINSQVRWDGNPPIFAGHTSTATPNSNRKRGARRARQNKSPALRLMEKDAQANHVPQFQSTVHVRHHFRYFAATALNGSLTRAELLNLLVVADSTVTEGWRIFSGIKLNRVEIRAVSQTSGAGSDTVPLTISVEWTSTYGPSSEVSDSGTPIHPPLIITSPPPQSLASFWSLTGSNESDVIALYNIPQGAVIDIWVDAILQDGQTPVSVNGFSSMTAGQVYALALDGRASNKLQPVSYTTTS
jgi:hypothetical protein